jgi:hypothetical protein
MEIMCVPSKWGWWCHIGFLKLMILEKWQLQWLSYYWFAQILNKEGCSTLLPGTNQSVIYNKGIKIHMN